MRTEPIQGEGGAICEGKLVSPRCEKCRKKAPRQTQRKAAESSGRQHQWREQTKGKGSERQRTRRRAARTSEKRQRRPKAAAREAKGSGRRQKAAKDREKEQVQVTRFSWKLTLLTGGTATPISRPRSSSTSLWHGPFATLPATSTSRSQKKEQTSPISRNRLREAGNTRSTSTSSR